MLNQKINKEQEQRILDQLDRMIQKLDDALETVSNTSTRLDKNNKERLDKYNKEKGTNNDNQNKQSESV